ncbi:DUF2905 domain-containing protein [Blastopirellula sp. JC732]|uniref:DUF2905 domain-containing protein n=1 Tax=Blastopirellula sediminis TaxID=2894196 RepID=A0A9X1SKZ5_9BACT|nr:DUF2905 domain-containing protein [Blastopirellula sediminis]MCC9606433.1 DUF2905 domain-containing protein [Blastopirellula sediminis]MCC9630269.1 DUF2905 domain-containing protein [Blastopirellula sediminis]
MQQLGWTLLAIGGLICTVGLGLLLAVRIPWLGRLPGDIRIEGEHVRFYFPIVTCILLSLILSGAAWLVRFLWR